MKNCMRLNSWIMFLVGVQVALSATTHASTYCMAKLTKRISEGSSIQFNVECSDGKSFIAQKMATHFWFVPLSKHPEERALQGLEKSMLQKGLKKVANIAQRFPGKSPNGHYETPILVFSDNKNQEDFLVLNYKENGKQGPMKQSTFDFNVSTVAGGLSEIELGYSADQLNQFIASEGFTKVFETKNNQLPLMQTIALYKK